MRTSRPMILAAALSVSVSVGLLRGADAPATKTPEAKATTKPADSKGAKPQAAAKEEKPKIYELTDYGPVYSSTVVGKSSTTNKAITIKVGPKEHGAQVCFDTDLLRYSAGWTGGWLKLNHGRDGLEGAASIDGKIAFATKATPGWAAGENDMADPRPKPFGPIPREQAHYKGLYLNGDNVVLSYTVGETKILETPGLISFDNGDVFTRTVSVAQASKALTNVLLEQSGGTGAVLPFGQSEGKEVAGDARDHFAVMTDKDNCVAAVVTGAAAGATLEIVKAQVRLKLPAGPACKVGIFTWAGPKSELPSFAKAVETGMLAKAVAALPAVDPSALIAGGKPRWTETLETTGKLGTEPGAYALDTIAVPDKNPWNVYMRLTGLDFFPDGRAAVADIGGDVWIVSGIDAKLDKVTWKRYASGMFQSLGLKIVDGKIYVLNRDQITRLHDLNDDGEADFYENFNNDCMVQNQYHEYAHDLHTDAAGNFYYMKGSDLGNRGTTHNGTMLKVSKDGSKTEIVATGFRAPNGMCVGPNGELTTGDNQGNWTPLCPINWVTPGGFYGYVLENHPNSLKTSPRADPICWLPMSADNSAGGQVWATGGKWGPYDGRLLHTSYGKCALFAVMIQDVGGRKQGGVIKFPFKFASGSMRPRFNPADGQLYVSGMRGWQTDGANPGCLQRVRYTGKAANMPLDLAVTKTGVQITFTDPLDKGAAADVQNWAAQWFNVRRDAGYGSKEYGVAEPTKVGRETVEISEAKVSDDGKKVTLTIPGIKPVTNMVLTYRLKAADGTEIKQEIDHTINVMPE